MLASPDVSIRGIRVVLSMRLFGPKNVLLHTTLSKFLKVAIRIILPMDIDIQHLAVFSSVW
jgi:hypothetical protein